MSQIETTLSQSDRDALIAAIEAADLESPEQVADMVLEAAEQGGVQAGRDRLAKCISDA